MARSQNWTRNIPKKTKKTRTNAGARNTSGIVDDGALEGLKRRAEDLGLIVHARPAVSRRGVKKKKDDEK
jgi:hypothetical protein